MTMDNRALSENFLMAAQALMGVMLEQFKAAKPHDAERLANAVNEGASVSLAYTFGETPAIELLLRADRVALPVCSIPLDSITEKPLDS
jgi:hypothetical protein